MRLVYLFLILIGALAYLSHRLGWFDHDPNSVSVHWERSEFGTIWVEDQLPYLRDDQVIKVVEYRRLLYSGTLHDMQRPTKDQDLIQALAWSLPPTHALGTICACQAGLYGLNRLTPLTYYHRSGPMGQFFPAVCSGASERAPLAFLGVGAGSVAAYGRPGQPVTFFEIDPALIRVAREHFTFLRDSVGKIDFVVGEPRAKIAEAPDGRFRLIVVNPVGGEFTPLNCLTREAIQLFVRKLSDGGVVALHISHRYLEEEGVLGNIAADLKLAGLSQYDDDTSPALFPGKNSSHWVLIARKRDDFGPLLNDARWRELKSDPNSPLWTDQKQDVEAVRRR